MTPWNDFLGIHERVSFLLAASGNHEGMERAVDCGKNWYPSGPVLSDSPVSNRPLEGSFMLSITTDIWAWHSPSLSPLHKSVLWVPVGRCADGRQGKQNVGSAQVPADAVSSTPGAQDPKHAQLHFPLSAAGA